MKRLVLLLLAAGAAYFAYRYAVVDAPVRAAQGFLKAWAREDTAAASALTDGGAAKTSVETHILRGVCRAPMEALGGSHASVETRSNEPSGRVVLTMHQLVAFDPPGITSGFASSMAASFRHVVTLEKGEAGWRVCGFEPSFLDAVPTRGR